MVRFNDKISSWRRIGKAQSWQEHHKPEVVAKWFDDRERYLMSTGLFMPQEAVALHWLPVRSKEMSSIVKLRRAEVVQLMEAPKFKTQVETIRKTYEARIKAHPESRRELLIERDNAFKTLTQQQQKVIVEAIYEARLRARDFGATKIEDYIDEVYDFLMSEDENELGLMLDDFFGNNQVRNTLKARLG